MPSSSVISSPHIELTLHTYTAPSLKQSAFRAALLEMYLERGRVNMDKKAWQELGDLIGKTDVQVKDFWRKVFYPRLQKVSRRWGVKRRRAAADCFSLTAHLNPQAAGSI